MPSSSFARDPVATRPARRPPLVRHVRRACRAAVLGVLLIIAVPNSAHAARAPGAALRESENPSSDQVSRYNYRSNVTRVTPDLPGLKVEVLQYVDRLLLTNDTGETVTVYGYQKEPYARLLADGKVELNTRSRAYYLNQNFFGVITVPPSATPTARPSWTVVNKTGRLEWHDHRIHWMLPGIPPQVTNRAKRTKIFDWSVPISVGTERGAVDGELEWVPDEDWTPLVVFGGLIVVVIAGAALVLFRRRRNRRATGRLGSGTGATGSGPGEAW